MGGLWREVSEHTDDKLGMVHIEHTETELSYLLCTFVCGKETGLSVGNGLLLIQS